MEIARLTRIRTDTRRQSQFHAETHKGIRTMTRDYLNFETPTVSCLGVESWPSVVQLLLLAGHREELVARRSTLHDDKGGETVVGLVMMVTKTSEGFKSFVGASFSDQWHPESVGVWPGSVDVSRKSHVPSPSRGWSFFVAVLRNSGT